MNKNRFLKALMFITVFGISAFVPYNVKAGSCNVIITQLLKTRAKSSSELDKIQDKALSVREPYDLKTVVQSSEKYKGFMAENGKKIKRDSAVFVFMLLHIESNGRMSSGEKENILERLICMRTPGECMEDEAALRLINDFLNERICFEFLNRYQNIVDHVRKYRGFSID